MPVDPTGGTVLALGLDDSIEVNLSGGAAVKLYERSYSRFFVGSNGYLTFNTPDTTFGESWSAHFNQPRVSALFDDLAPSKAGKVSWRQLADGVAVTWEEVPEILGSIYDANTFQVWLGFDGTISLSYLEIAAEDGTETARTGAALRAVVPRQTSQRPGVWWCRGGGCRPTAGPIVEVGLGSHEGFARSNSIVG